MVLAGLDRGPKRSDGRSQTTQDDPKKTQEDDQKNRVVPCPAPAIAGMAGSPARATREHMRGPHGTRSKAARSKAARPDPAAAKHRVRPAFAVAGEPPGTLPDWPQLKLDIVRRYGAAYSTISSRQPGLAHYWIDGFTGSGTDTSTQGFAPGNALNALLVTPPFHHHYLVSLDGQPAHALRRAVDGRAGVTLLEGGGSRALLE